MYLSERLLRGRESKTPTKCRRDRPMDPRMFGVCGNLREPCIEAFDKTRAEQILCRHCRIGSDHNCETILQFSVSLTQQVHVLSVPCGSVLIGFANSASL